MGEPKKGALRASIFVSEAKSHLCETGMTNSMEMDEVCCQTSPCPVQGFFMRPLNMVSGAITVKGPV